jgi:hypothetical protein
VNHVSDELIGQLRRICPVEGEHSFRDGWSRRYDTIRFPSDDDDSSSVVSEP